MADIEVTVCNQCKFYHVYDLDREGNCRKNAPVVVDGGGLYGSRPTWPKVYGNSMWCGEFVYKYSKEVTV